MSQFFERNKRKGLLSVLLLFFQRGKGGGPLLLMVTLLAFVFIIPASTLINSPFTRRLGQLLGLRSDLGGGAMMTEGGGLKAGLAMDEASRKAMADPGALFNGADAVARYGKSTVDLVQDGGVEKAKSEAVEKLNEEGKKDVDGVLRPEDAKDMKDGVPLSNDELVNGLMKNAEAAGWSNAGGRMGDGGGGGGFSLGLANRQGNGSGARASSQRDDLLNRSLNSANVPGAQGKARGVAQGKLNWRDFNKINARVSAAVGGSKTSSKNTAMYQLAEGRAYSVAAAPPPGKCDPNSCPGEYASNTGGSMFDGGKPRGSILSSPEMGDPTTPQVPSESDINDMTQEASQMEQDAKQCEAANAEYGPQLDKKSGEIQDLSNQLNQMDCGGGGCSGSKAQACKRVGDQMKVKCQEYNSIAQQWAGACPLTEGRYNAMNCNQ